MQKEILIIRLSSIGDVIHCTPVASSLKAAWDDCKITWLVGEVCADLLQYNPYIDEIIVWSREKFDKCLKRGKLKEAFLLWADLKTKLRGKEFYAVLDIHGLFLTGMISRLVKSERRIGLSGARELNPLFMTETGEPLGEHITDKYLGALTCLGIKNVDHKMSLFIPVEARQFAQNFLKEHDVSLEENILVLILGTTWPTKNWPPAFFAELIQLLAFDFKIILCGGKAEINLGKEVVTKAGVTVINTIGHTGLLEMAGILKEASVVVTGDTGPLHMAAALNVSTVSIFGPTNPAVYAPQGKKHAILVSNTNCAHCHKMQCPKGEAECMNRITPEEVAHKVYEITRGKN